VIALLESPAVTVPSGDEPRSIDELTECVSASRISTWQQCRLKFFFRYVLGLRKRKSAALHLGSCVHETLKFWNRARWRNEPASVPELQAAYSSAWTAAQETNPAEWEEGKEDEQKALGWRLLETYFRDSPIPADEKVEAVEVSVEADLQHHGLPTLIGIIDLVRQGGRIVDFKSSGRTPDPEKAPHLNETQLTAYSILYRNATGRVESAIELHHLIKTKVAKLVVTQMDPATEAQKTRLLRVIESYTNGLQRADWIPSPGIQCSSCEFFNECRAWR
jgi:putative RecB family exonuclease